MSDQKDFASSIYSAFKKKNSKKLRKLQDKILKKAVLSHTKELFDLAVFTYVLSKITSKPRFIEPQNAEWIEAIEIDLLELTESSEKSSKQWNNAVSSLRKTITSLEKEDTRYLISFIRKGELKSAAKLYAQGISLGLASQITGMEKQEILDYAGKTMMFDRVKEEQDIFDRVKTARKILSG